MRIGALETGGNVFLAPLAGYSDITFRSLCVGFGASMTYTEMVSAEGLIRDGGKTRALLERASNEKCWAIQLFGSCVSSMAKAAAVASREKPSLIDINAGCPVPKVNKTEAGVALMKKPALAAEIIRAMKAETDIPITIKFRLGQDAGSINFLEFADAVQKAGADAICLHSRTRAQGYSGKADWDCIKALKQNSGVPVIGSGDLFSPDDVKRMFTVTGCDAAMLARGALGNPFLFKETMALMNGQVFIPAIPERFEVALAHLDGMIARKGENRACVEFRKIGVFYLKGIERSGEARKAVIHAKKRDDYIRIFDDRSDIWQMAGRF